MINQVFLDPSSPWTITGSIEFDTDSAHLKMPQGTSFPTSPETGDYFYKTDTNIAYRYNGSTWDAVTAVPGAHAASHQSGGSDPIKLDDLATPDDNTDLNATTERHGLLLKLGGGTTNYLRADGTWATPSGSGSTFGQGYTSAVSEGTSTTTSATYQDKVTLTTGAWTGTYLINWQCEIMTGAANTRHQCRLYDVTNATELDMDDQRPSAASMYTLVHGFALVTLAGAATTYKIQFASQGGSATITIRRARATIWRVA